MTLASEVLAANLWASFPEALATLMLGFRSGSTVVKMFFRSVGILSLKVKIEITFQELFKDYEGEINSQIKTIKKDKTCLDLLIKDSFFVFWLFA